MLSSIFAIAACALFGASIEIWGLAAICVVWDLIHAADTRKQIRVLEEEIEDLERPIDVERAS